MLFFIYFTSFIASTMDTEESSSPGNTSSRLPSDEFREKLEFLQQDINIKAKMSVLSEEDTPSPGLMEFLTKMKGTPVSILARFCQIKGIPVFNYFCLEVPESQ